MIAVQFDAGFRRGGFWLIVALLSGLGIALLPLDVLPISLAIISFLVVATVTPLAALCVMVVLAPMRTLIATESAFQLPLDIGQLSLLAFIAAWAVHRIARGQPLLRLHWSTVYIPLLVFILVGGLTAFSATSLSSWMNEWLKWVQILVLAALVINLSAGRQWEWVVFGLVCAGTANAIVGIYQYLGGSGALHLLVNERNFRAFGTFGQPNPFGGFMGLLIPLALMSALGYAVHFVTGWQQSHKVSWQGLIPVLFYAAASVMMLAGLFMSWSRGAWLSIVITMVVVAVALPRKTSISLLICTTMLGGLLLLWFSGLLPASIVERLNSATREFSAIEDVRGVDIDPENYANVERLAHWQAALNMADANPWLGVGLGNYEVVYPQYRLINWNEPLGHAHNYYLNILAEGGIIGLLGYIKVWGLIIWLTWQTRKHPDSLARFVVIGLLGTWVYLSIHHLFDNLYVNNTFLQLGLMLGILGTLYNHTHNTVRLRAL